MFAINVSIPSDFRLDWLLARFELNPLQIRQLTENLTKADLSLKTLSSRWRSMYVAVRVPL